LLFSAHILPAPIIRRISVATKANNIVVEFVPSSVKNKK
jgi:hypothetical protein